MVGNYTIRLVFTLKTQFSGKRAYCYAEGDAFIRYGIVAARRVTFIERSSKICTYPAIDMLALLIFFQPRTT